MADRPTITKLELNEYQFELPDFGRDSTGFNLVYAPGARMTFTKYAYRIRTDEGVSGEYLPQWFGGPESVGQALVFGDYMIGKNPLERERIYSEIKRALRHYDGIGFCPVDVALWDLAGKYLNVGVSEMLGGFRKKIPAYASTFHGDHNGGLDSPEAYADFAERCLEMGYTGFKIHGWSDVPIRQEVDLVHTVGRRVGGKMDLMLDPACEYETFADALKVGRALDEEGFLWYEDPFKDGGISSFAHSKLRQLIKTPLLQGEHLRHVEPHADQIIAGATDFARPDPELDGGITGTMKIAHTAEALGLDVEVHASGPAHRACISAMRNANYYEMALVHPKCANVVPPAYKCGYADQIDSIDADGNVDLPEGPGLGVEYDWDWIEAHRTGYREFG